MSGIAAAESISRVRAIRVFVEHRGRNRRVCTVIVDRKDGSIYICPNRDRGQSYFSGTSFFRPGQSKTSFDFTNQILAAGTPKISVHMTGQVHVRTGGRMTAGPLWLQPLHLQQRAHIVTIVPDSMAALPLFAGSLQTKVSRVEHAFLARATDSDANCRVVVQVSPRPHFRAGFFVRKITGLLWYRPLYLGIGVIETPVFESRGGRDLTMLAGMDPRIGSDQHQHFAWVVSSSTHDGVVAAGCTRD